MNTFQSFRPESLSDRERLCLPLIASQIVRLERLNNSINKSGQLMQRRDNRLTMKSLSIAESYLESAFELLAYLEALHHPSGETIYRQAIFNWSNPAICHRKKRRTISPCDQAVRYPSKVKNWVQY